MLTSLEALILKELRQTFRDRRMLFVLLAVPVIQLVVLGFAVNLEVEHVPVVVVDLDHSDRSRDLLDDMTAGDTFDRRGEVATVKEAIARLESGAVTLAVVVPRGFAADLDHRRAVQVQVLVDGSDSSRAIVAQNAAASYVTQRSLALARERLAAAAAARGVAARFMPVRLEPRILYNPTLNSRIYFVPGVAATLLLIVTITVTAMGIAREKEMGTLEQVMVTPIRPAALILGKTLPYAFIGLLDLGLVVGAGAWIFDLPLRGNLLILVLAGTFYLLTVLGIGLFLSTIAKNQQQAFMGAFIIIMPAILLSGFMTPIENMPGWIRPFTVANPVRHMVEVMRGVLLKGATVGDLAPQIVALAGTGVTVYLLAALLLHRSLR